MLKHCIKWATIISLFVFAQSQSLQATHIVGADLVYTCTRSTSTSQTYRIELTMYRDCTPNAQAGFDVSINLFIFNGDDKRLAQTKSIGQSFTPRRVYPIDYEICTGMAYSSQSLCVEYGTYVTTIILPRRRGGYDVAWSRCCRNNAVTNIQSGPGPGSQGITVLAHIPSADVTNCNSSPRFKKLAPVFLCAGQQFTFDHSASDSDNDSLVYVVSNPYTGINNFGNGTTAQNPVVDPNNNPMGPPPYRNVVYLGGYSYLNPFRTGNFRIDPQSGLLNFTPSQPGLFVFAISVLEYRNGVLMNENKRDFQIQVLRCQPQGNPPNVNSNLASIGSTPNDSLYTSNDTIYALPNQEFCYDVQASDPAANDVVLLFEASAPFGIGGTLPAPYAQLSAQIGNPARGRVCWKPSCDYAGQTVKLVIGSMDTADCEGYNITFDTVMVVVGGAHAPVISHQLSGGGNSVSIHVGENFCYDYEARDEDARDSIRIRPLSGPFAALGGVPPYASLTQNGKNPTRGRVCWTPGCEHAGQQFLFTLQAKDINRCNKSFPRNDAITVNVKPTPTVDAPTRVEGCQGERVRIQATATGPGTFRWEPAALVDDPTRIDPLARVGTSPRLLFVTYTDTFGCEHKDSTLVSPLAPFAVTTSPDTSICIGDSAALRVSGGVSYQWSPAANISDPTASQPWANPSVSTTYQVLITGSNGCQDTAYIRVRVNPLPLPDAGADTVKCGDVAIQIQASGGQSYQWSPARGLSNPSIANPLANPDSSTYYHVIVTDANGCKAEDSVFVRTFYARAGADIEVCRYDTIRLMATRTGIAHQWDTDPAILDPLHLLNPRAYSLVDKAFYLTVTDSSGCQDRDTVRLIVHPLPVLSLYRTEPYVCSGGPTQIGVRVAGGRKYRWGPAATIDDDTLAEPTVRPVNLGPQIIDSVWYYVTVTDSNACVSHDSIGLEVRIRPDIRVSRDTFICPGDTVSIWMKGGHGVQRAWWDYPIGQGDSVLFPPDSGRVRAFPDTTTYYRATVEAVWGCTNSDSIQVYIINPQAGMDSTICYGDTIRMQGSGGVSYRWSPVTGLADPTDPQTLAWPTQTTNYTLVVRDSVGCIDSASVRIDVTPPPPADAGGDQEICIGDSIRLQGSGGVSYQWMPDDSLSADTVADPLAWPRVSTRYVLEATGPTGCKARDTMRLTVHPLPVVDVSSDVTICRNSTTLLRASGALAYLWRPGESLSDSTIANPIAEPDSTTLYRVRGTDTHGCVNYDSVKVSVIQLPVDSISPNDSICKFQSATLWVRGNAQSYLWNTGQTRSEIQVDPQYSTTYWVIPYGEEGCPADTLFTHLYVERKLPVARFKPLVTEGFYQLSVQFENMSEHASRFTWHFGDEGTSHERDPIHIYRRPGQYEVELIADNEIGCPSSLIYQYIEVWSERLYFPNAFSPNGDGRTSTFTCLMVE